MALKHSQVNRIKEALANTGIDPQRFGFHKATGPNALVKAKFKSETLEYRDGETGWFCAFYIPTSSEDWECWAAPGRVLPYEHLSENSFDKLLPFIQNWCSYLARELAEPKLWSDESKAKLQWEHLLPSQQNFIYRCLVNKNANLDRAVWGSTGTEALLQIPRGNFSFSFGLKDGKFAGKYKPAEHKSGDKYGHLPWPQLEALVDNWAGWVAEEQAELAKTFPVVTASSQEPNSDLRLLSLRLDGIRNFKDFRLPFRSRSATILIGENGVGKTTILRAIALAMCPRADADTLLARPLSRLLSDGSLEGRIELEYGGPSQEPRRRVVVIKRVGGREQVEETLGDDIPLFSYATGAVRGPESVSTPVRKDYRRFQSLESLFAYDIPVANAELTLSRSQKEDPAHYDRLRESLQSILGLEPGLELSLTGDGLIVNDTRRNTIFPVHHWADGYRLKLAWVTDLFSWSYASGINDLQEASGLLLVDEIEQHLHPSLQATVVPRLKQSFPSLQIIATTHSPIAVLGTEPEELVVLQDSGQTVKALPGLRSRSISVEDMLTSERGFDTSPYAPLIQAKLREHVALSKIPFEQRTDEQSARLRQLVIELNSEEIELEVGSQGIA